MSVMGQKRTSRLASRMSAKYRRERQMDGIAKAKERGIKFGRRLELTPDEITEIRSLRADGRTVPEIIRQVGLSKATVYRALTTSPHHCVMSRLPSPLRTSDGTRNTYLYLLRRFKHVDPLLF
jgi:hypothetical protein